MPHPAHFVAAEYCRFRLATYVNGVIVSTVGELLFDEPVQRIHASIHDKKWYATNSYLKGDLFFHAYFVRFGFDDLHLGGWKYETMVFGARKADDKEICCPYRSKIEDGREEKVYKTAVEATMEHYKLVKKYEKK